MKKKILQIRISEDIAAQFNFITHKKAVNKSEIIRRFIEDYIKKNREDEKNV